MTIYRVTLGVLVLLAGVSARAGDAKAEVQAIAADITKRCLDGGLLACEPNMRGVPTLFNMVRARDGLLDAEQKFTEFMRTRYPEKPFELSRMNATLDLNLNIEITPKGMLHDPVSAVKVPGGYDVTLKDGEIVQMRRDHETWYLQASASQEEKAKQIFDPYLAASKLKSKILVYHMIEAELTSMDRETLEDKVCIDLAPLVAKMLGPKKVPPETVAHLPPLDEVVKFYGQFDSPDDMERYIRSEHHLGN